MNSVRKGNRNQHKCFIELQNAGYICWTAKRTKWGGNDLFDLFDIAAMHPKGRHLLLVQVKSNKCDKQVREAIKAFKVPPHIFKQVWIWVDRKGWRMYENL